MSRSMPPCASAGSPVNIDPIVGRVHGDGAVARSRVALQELLVEGIETNIPFHRAILQDETFLTGGFDTNLLDRKGAAAFLAAVEPEQGA